MLASMGSHAQRRKAKSSSAPTYTTTQNRFDSFEARKGAASVLGSLQFKNIGPKVMSGRVVDIAVNEADPNEFIAAFASGGLWHTKNNGLTFSSIFDEQATITIGDIAVDWANETIWLGSGENNSSRSSYAGTGMYKSENFGKTWQYIGLPESHHIGRVVLHPTNKEVAWVGVLGHLYSNNPERGVYLTTDGGSSWEKTLFINDSTGVVDITINPANPQILYAASWERSRSAWNFKESGKGSGLWKSVDGGKTWASASGNGFPVGDGVGRIGLAISKKAPSTIYAFLDNQNRRPTSENNASQGLTIDAFRGMKKESFMALAEDDINQFLDDNSFPQEVTAATLRQQIERNELLPSALADYLQNANNQLFDTPVIGAEVYRSDDSGQNWKKTHSAYIDDLVYSYGYYFGQIRVDPSDEDVLYIMGVPIVRSDDGGQSWKMLANENVHADHHALWINPSNPNHIINGNDGGINISYDKGETFFKINTLAVGQFYTVNVDMAEPYNVYGGLQDNGVWFGPHTSESSLRWQSSGQYPFRSIMGGDGMQVEIDTRDNTTVYTGYQFGNYFRVNTETGERTYITPSHTLGERPLRWNWQSPIHLSRHNQDVVYFGSNRFHRSLNQGNDFETLSGDLTKGGKAGDVPFGTLTTIHESPLRFGLLVAGSDDGLVHLSRDGGYSWKNISDGLPQNFWVSRAQLSAHAPNRLYVALNGYRNDNFKAMVFVSDNSGDSWRKITTGLPDEPVNVIKEDPKNPNLLYVGTDNGLYISINGGEYFMEAGRELPNVPIHDLVVHERENDLVLGTHGRSFYIADVSALQELTPKALSEEVRLFPSQNLTFSERWGNRPSYSWSDTLQPEVPVDFYLKEQQEVAFLLVDAEGHEVHKWQVDGKAGMNYTTYNLTASDPLSNWQAADDGNYYLPAGEYKIVVRVGGIESETPLVIKEQKQRPKRVKKKTP
jgi:photosystem II stability/assembly factor-like uncharacterized protein